MTLNRLKDLPVQSRISVFFPESVEIPVANLRNKKRSKEILSILLDAMDNGSATLSFAGLDSDPFKLYTQTKANHKNFKTVVLFQYHTGEPIFDFSKTPKKILNDISKAVRSAGYAMRYVDELKETGRTIIISVRESI